ncbi:NYN domain-containing protein [Leptolyngbya boryana CZ1]|uniref:NYN domain-containing protein n=1 Tax=Leptolyngbya boryana CZ1 TaxID=3060204 RepID=A0AA97ALZ7_LEPBY|nr:NYN domain-containing protein [Leptolyngbya boryana]WNZ44393.1 NYN domain-containing protein [Leptolyngbya boryana CZ1]
MGIFILSTVERTFVGERKLRDDRLAVLIDADNATASLIEPLMEEIAKYGTANVKRIYGDWTKPNLGGWKEKLHIYAIQPIQQYSYTSGKNATDSALIIDAMDLLYTGHFDGFCLVSSDSDFTRLACRLRESGLFVYGFGRKQTPIPFQKACDKFTYTEILVGHEVSEAIAESKNGQVQLSKNEHFKKAADLEKENPSSRTAKLQQDKKLINLLQRAYEAAAGEDGLANLGAFGSQINKISPSFDSRNYEYSKLGALIRDVGLFEIQEVPSEHNPVVKVVYVKLKG